MSNEKQTDTEHWKNKLEGLTSLPGEASITNKTAAWEKLHDRLHEKTRRNKMTWYWVAAACLLLVLLIPWMIINKKENGLVKSATQQKQNKTAPATVLPFIRKEQVTLSSAVSIEKKESIKDILDKRNLNSSNTTNKKDTTKKDEALIANTTTVIKKTPETAINTVAPEDSTAAITAVATVKKKMRVVHINELETAPATNQEQVAISVHHEQNNFKFQFRNILPVNQPAAPRQEYAALKIPLTN